MNIDDELELMAYLDGELDSVRTATIERRLINEPDLAKLARELTMSETLIQSAFDITDEPSPKAVGAQSEISVLPSPMSRRSNIYIALAASLATLCIGAVLGLFAINTVVDAKLNTLAESRQTDQAQRNDTLDTVLESQVSGVKVSWENPTSGNFGEVVPTSTYKTKSGQYCREFEEMVIVDGATTTEAGVACRTNDGRWKVRIRYYPE